LTFERESAKLRPYLKFKPFLEESMPHHKSAEKRVLTNEKARKANVAVKSRVRTALRKVRESRSRGDAEARLQTALSVLDRAAQKGIIHRSTASRHKSRLTLFVHKLPA
jgi:small subunit ribosomal protein S20